MKVLFIGSKGLVGKDFSAYAKNRFNVDEIDKKNSKEYEKLLKNNSYDFLVFAAQSEDYRNQDFSEDLFNINIEYLFRVVRSSVGRVRNIIFFSSGSVYKPALSEVDENSPVDFDSHNPYVISKITAELVLRPFQSKFNSIVVLRPFFIYGPKQNPQMLMQTMINKIKNESEIVLNNNQGLIFNPVFVRDVSEFIGKIIHECATGYFTYNVFGPEKTTLAKLVNDLGLRLGKVPNTKTTVDKPKTLLATSIYSVFSPRVGLEEGLTKTINAET